MQLISADQLINYKILPFDIYTEKGKKIFEAGEVVTPGKILQLKYMPAIYVEEEVLEEDVDLDIDEDYVEVLDEIPGIEIEKVQEEADFLEETVFKRPKFLGYYAKDTLIEKAQVEIKNKYQEMIDSFSLEGKKDVTLCLEIRDTIIEDIIPEVNRIFYKSQLKVYGDYNYSHGVNVAMLSALLAHKMKYSEQAVKDVTLAAILHDVGETKIPKSVLDKDTFTTSELKLIQLHTKLGYNIIKNELEMPEHIARVALQHHERPDGTGYPYGISGKIISPESYIVSLCDEYDRLTSGKGDVKIKTAKEAVKHLLGEGTKRFKSNVLYTFVHMTKYHDVAPL